MLDLGPDAGSADVLGVRADVSDDESVRAHHTVPDGIAFDVEGRLYIGCYTPSTIYTVEPDLISSQILAHDWTAQFMQAPTNLAFMGENLALLGSANLNGHHLNVLTPRSRGLQVQRPPF